MAYMNSLNETANLVLSKCSQNIGKLDAPKCPILKILCYYLNLGYGNGKWRHLYSANALSGNSKNIHAYKSGKLHSSS